MYMKSDHVFAETPLGAIRISGTAEFIVEVSFVEDRPPIKSETAFDLITECRDQLLAYFDGKRTKFEIPLHQSGTDFQMKVWNELSRISFGQTISYLDLAKKLNDPKVIRAAASANGRNQFAIIVPCHRVIGSSGKLVGYAGGLWRKRWLLEHEQRFAHGLQSLF
jgi:methylated-DNA-[protein]-cysteine S-methyltransferase